MIETTEIRLTPRDEVLTKAQALWTSLKEFDTIVVTPKQEEVKRVLMTYCSKDINHLFKVLGIYGNIE